VNYDNKTGGVCQQKSWPRKNCYDRFGGDAARIIAEKRAGGNTTYSVGAKAGETGARERISFFV
jgi:hypothetical protein